MNTTHDWHRLHYTGLRGLERESNQRAIEKLGFWIIVLLGVLALIAVV